MRLSIVIPAYNEETTLGRCLSSIQNALRTTPHDVEVIVVNNASTDRTREVASSFAGVKVVDESRKGIVWARSAGHEASTGTHVAHIDADTAMTSTWLKTVFDAFERDPDLIGLSGPYLYEDTSLFVRILTRVFYSLGYLVDGINQRLTGRGGMFQGGNYVVSRDAFNQIGGFDTSIAFYGEDTDIAQRMKRVGKIRWTFALPMNSSARRLTHDGVLKTGMTYLVNYVWVTLFRKPLHSRYNDIRIDGRK